MENIIDLDSGSAVTLFSSVEIVRENPHEELGMVDLENHVSQAIWQMLDGSRAQAAERLGINEVDLLLTDARVMGVKIDGHKVINPHGFTGKKLEVFLMLTMVRRDRFVESAYLLEGGSVRAYLVGRGIKEDEAVYIEITTYGTTIYSVSRSGVSYVGGFDWKIDAVIQALGKKFHIMDSATMGVYKRYVGGGVSRHVKRKIDIIFYDIFNDFINGVIMSLKNTGRLKNIPPVYLRSFIPIPEGVHRKRFEFGGKTVKLFLADESLELRDFTEEEVHKVYGELNELAKRRIKWLMPTM